MTVLLSVLTLTNSAVAADLTKSKGIDQDIVVQLVPEPASIVSIDTAIYAQFGVDLDSKHIKKNDVKLRCLSCRKQGVIKGTVSYSVEDQSVIFTPQNTLQAGIYEIEYKSLKTTKEDKKVKINNIKYLFETIPTILESLTISPNNGSLEIGETLTLNISGSYSDGTTQIITDGIEWIVSDANIASINANGILTALNEGSVTIQAKKGTVLSNEITIEIKPPVVLESLAVFPSPVNLRINSTVRIDITGHYSDGTTKALGIEDGINYTIGSDMIAMVNASGEVEGLAEGTTTLQVNVNATTSSQVDIVVGGEIETDNFDFTNFGNQYLDQIPANATKTNYDEKRFCMIAGQVFSEDGSPLSKVKVSIHQHPEFGTTYTDENGTYTIPAEGGLTFAMRYSKEKYTTIDRKVAAPIKDWVKTEDVTMLQMDSKVTTIDLSNAAAQTHISTPVDDDRGERSTTLVFDGVTGATVTSADGSTRQLTTFDVRATEFKTPESMPANLPKESAYTYCSDLKVDGTNDNDEVTFDAPVVMYVDNFLGFDIGEIVPVGYYDRKLGEWVGSDNGVVVALLDTDSDGKIDALDSTGDGQPNDLNGNGSFSDEVAGISDNPEYAAGKSYWRAAFTHFTPWDHNWPYAPPTDAEAPDQDDPESDDDQPNDCKINVSSYVSGKSRVFHEDIPVTGTNITLHYSSKRTDGYKHIIDASVDTSTIPSSVVGVKVRLKVAGRTLTKNPNISELDHLEFIWDGKDALGRKVTGEITATVEFAYKYQLVYMRGTTQWAQAWAQAGTESTGVVSRQAIEYTSSKKIKLNAESTTNSKSEIANGWVVDNSYRMITGNGLFQGV
jgi:hypothetical protein